MTVAASGRLSEFHVVVRSDQELTSISVPAMLSAGKVFAQGLALPFQLIRFQPTLYRAMRMGENQLYDIAGQLSLSAHAHLLLAVAQQHDIVSDLVQWSYSCSSRS